MKDQRSNKYKLNTKSKRVTETLRESTNAEKKTEPLLSSSESGCGERECQYRSWGPSLWGRREGVGRCVAIPGMLPLSHLGLTAVQGREGGWVVIEGEDGLRKEKGVAENG